MAARTETKPDDALARERERVLELLRRHGFNTTSFQALEDGLAYWWDSPDACVAYADTRRAWVAAGAPIAATEALPGVAERFVAAARASGKRAVFFATQDRLADLPGMVSVPVGAQPVWDPRAWAETARSSRSLRSQLSRATNKGVVVRRASAEELRDASSRTRREVEALVARWLGTRRMTPMAFLVHVQPFSFAEERRAYVAEHSGRVVGFLSAVPVYARGGWFVEDLLRDRDAPNGTTELLVDAAMRGAASEGSTWATLGMAPLAGPAPAWMRRVGALARPLYDFAGVHAFKEKLSPARWESVHVTHPADVRTSVAVLDALRAFAGGGLASFALRTLIEGPAPVLWVLALLLVPWMAALAVADAAYWFPWSVAKPLWIAFDVAMLAAMTVLARRFRRRLAVATACAAVADAVLTWWQVLAWNLPRASGVLELALLAAACAGPVLAAIVLVRGIRRFDRASARVR